MSTVIDLSGRCAVVTGAARGLGRAYAEALAAAGAGIVAADRADCGDTVAAIEAKGGRAVGHRTDVTDAASVEAMAEAAVAAFGGIDILINNAALYASLTSAPFDRLDEAEWDACMAVNAKGIWLCCRAVVPSMKERGGGSVINISSLAATYGLPNALHYTASKAAVIGITRGLARELGRYWIRVNAIAPSAVMTEGTAEFFGDKLERAAEVIRENQSLKQSLQPDDLVGAVLFLCSDSSRFVTGQTLMVDGGTTFL